jgi:SAM-dependent methyltransferase
MHPDHFTDSRGNSVLMRAPAKTLSAFDAIAIIVGIVIGAGIFKTPSLVAANSGSESAAVLLWFFGGVISLIGALCYAELTTSYPDTGGDYHFIRRAFGNYPAFLFAWARMTVIQTGSIAMLAFIIGDYASQVFRINNHSSSWYAALVIILFTAINVTGIRQGTSLQKVLTAAIVLGLLSVVFAGLSLDSPAEPSGDQGFSVPGKAMIFVLLTYGGWNEAAYISAELKHSERNMIRVLVFSIGIITLVYMAANLVFLKGLGLAATARSEAVAADFMRLVMGENGARFVSILIVVAALSTMNAVIITGARTNYALGRDFMLFRFHSIAADPARERDPNRFFDHGRVYGSGILVLFPPGRTVAFRPAQEGPVQKTSVPRSVVSAHAPPVLSLLCLHVSVELQLCGNRSTRRSRRAYCRNPGPVHCRDPRKNNHGKRRTSMIEIYIRLSVLALILSAGFFHTVSINAGQLSWYRTVQIQKTPVLDVPYVPTPYEVVNKMLSIAEVNSKDTLYDLGCGDGRIVVTAAKELNVRKAIGIDIDPQRIQESNENARQANVSDRVIFQEKDLFEVDFHEATVVSLYLLPSVNLKLRPKLLHDLKPGARIVSHDFDMGEWLPDRTVQLNEHTIYFWVIPATVNGTWKVNIAGGKENHRYELKLSQHFQNLQKAELKADDVEKQVQDMMLKGDKIEFTIKDGLQGLKGPVHFSGSVKGDSIQGFVSYRDGLLTRTLKWHAERDGSTVVPIDITGTTQLQL